MIAQQNKMKDQVAERKAEREKKQSKYEEAQRKLQEEQRNRYEKNKAVIDEVLNVFTLGIYGAVIEESKKNEKKWVVSAFIYDLIIYFSYLNERVKNAQTAFDNAKAEKHRAEGEYLSQLKDLSDKMNEIAGRTSEPDLSHRNSHLQILLLMKI